MLAKGMLPSLPTFRGLEYHTPIRRPGVRSPSDWQICTDTEASPSNHVAPYRSGMGDLANRPPALTRFCSFASFSF
jgi:hypothetical protein